MLESLSRLLPRALYNGVLMPLAAGVFFVLQFFSPKFADRMRGLRAMPATLRELGPKAERQRVWIHASSMGEFEQAKPLIERLRRDKPHIQIIVSFYSPSGYNNQRNYPLADAVVYMPLDSRARARRFLDLLQPDLAVFVRYDVWPNHLLLLAERAVPSYLICATVNEKSLRLSSLLLPFSRTVYNSLSGIFSAGATETAKFAALRLGRNVLTAADTRFDRISAVVEEARKAPYLAEKLRAPEGLTLVIGSSWPAEEDMLAKALDQLEAAEKDGLQVIIAAHEPTAQHVAKLQTLFPGAQILSALESGSAAVTPDTRPRVIIVDSIGKLLRLYAHADCAIIGGGFGAGVHSVTEPAGYGIPLACGPGIERARDAIALQELGALEILRNTGDCTAFLRAMIADPEERRRKGAIAAEYVSSQSGFSERIAAVLLEKLG